MCRGQTPTPQSSVHPGRPRAGGVCVLCKVGPSLSLSRSLSPLNDVWIASVTQATTTGGRRATGRRWRWRPKAMHTATCSAKPRTTVTCRPSCTHSPTRSCGCGGDAQAGGWRVQHGTAGADGPTRQAAAGPRAARGRGRCRSPPPFLNVRQGSCLLYQRPLHSKPATATRPGRGRACCPDAGVWWTRAQLGSRGRVVIKWMGCVVICP